jgi:hypothetical protein
MRKKLIISIAIFLILVISIRIALPYVVLHYANKELATLEGYRGHVNDIDIALLRGAYQLDSVYLNKYDSAKDRETPFFGAKRVDLSIEWQSLFKGSLVGEVELETPTLRFTKDKVEPKDVRKDSTELKEGFDKFMPLKVNRLEINDGRIQYIDASSKPRVDIQLTHAHIIAKNLRNAYDSTVTLPATIQAKAEIYDGTLDLFMKLNPLAEDPTFDMNAELRNTNLVKLNDFFQAYAKVDVSKGRFGLYTEAAAKDGYFSGYVKPIMKDLDLTGIEDRKDNVLRKLWEGFADAVGEVVENKSKEQVATKIPLKGKLDDPTANIWYTIGSVLENAFIRAIQPSIDHEISLGDVESDKKEKKNFLEKIFDKKESDDDDKKDGKDKKKKD